MLFSKSRRNVLESVARPGIEPLESRSLLSAALTVTVPGPVPQSAVAGFMVHDRIAINIANNGDAPAKGPIGIALFTSTDGVLSSDDAEIGTPLPSPSTSRSGRTRHFSSTSSHSRRT